MPEVNTQELALSQLLMDFKTVTTAYTIRADRKDVASINLSMDFDTGTINYDIIERPPQEEITDPANIPTPPEPPAPVE